MYWPVDIYDYCQCLMDENSKFNTILFDKNSFMDNLQTVFMSYINFSKVKKVLIKTSVTGKRRANHEIHPFVLEKIFYELRCLLPDGELILADGPAYVRSYEKECVRLGWKNIIQQYDVNVLDLNYDDFVCINNFWPVAKSWFESDIIINVSKAKTHRRFGVTLSAKNLLGILSAKKLGYPKLAHLHEYVPKLLSDIILCSPEMVNIIDGINGIEGNGPMHGYKTDSNFVVIGTDCYNCDVNATIQMGFHPCVVPANIRPFKHKAKRLFEVHFDRLSINDYLPSFSCFWMYKSLNKSYNYLNSIYLNLLNGIKLCWEKEFDGYNKKKF